MYSNSISMQKQLQNEHSHSLHKYRGETLCLKIVSTIFEELCSHEPKQTHVSSMWHTTQQNSLCTSFLGFLLCETMLLAKLLVIERPRLSLKYRMSIIYAENEGNAGMIRRGKQWHNTNSQKKRKKNNEQVILVSQYVHTIRTNKNHKKNNVVLFFDFTSSYGSRIDQARTLRFT